MKRSTALALTAALSLAFARPDAARGDEEAEPWKAKVGEAQSRFEAGQFNEAETLWNTALVAMGAAGIRPDAPERVEAYRALGTIYARLGKPERAAIYRVIWVRMLLARSEDDGRDVDLLVHAFRSLARAYEAIGRWDAAHSAIREAIAVRGNGDVATVAEDELELARHFRRRNLLDKADVHYQRAIALLVGPPSWFHAQIKEEYAELLATLGRDDEAYKLLEEARHLRFGSAGIEAE